MQDTWESGQNGISHIKHRLKMSTNVKSYNYEASYVMANKYWANNRLPSRMWSYLGVSPPYIYTQDRFKRTNINFRKLNYKALYEVAKTYEGYTNDSGLIFINKIKKTRTETTLNQCSLGIISP